MSLIRACSRFLGLVALSLASASAWAGLTPPFTPGNLVVVRVGDGTAALTSASTAVFLDEYTVDGMLVQSIALPTADALPQRALTLSGTATSEGFLNLADNGVAFTMAGYATPPGTASVASTTASAVNRVVARIQIFPVLIDTSTSLTNAHSTNNIRSACSPDGSQFYTTGPGSNPTFGIRHVPSVGSTTSTQLVTTPANIRVGRTIRGNLYFSAASLTYQGLAQVGTGLPTMSGQTATLLPGFPTSSGPSPYDFAIIALSPTDNRVAYVADDRTIANGGGIQKWVRDPDTGIWSLQYTLNNGLANGCRGLVLASRTFDQGVPTHPAALNRVTIYATTAGNQLVRVVDTGPASAFSVLATGPTNTAMRGIRRVPDLVPCAIPFINISPLRQKVTVGGSASFTILGPVPEDIIEWYKVGPPDTLIVDSPTVSGATTTTLTISPVALSDAGRYYAVVRRACDEALVVLSPQGELEVNTGGPTPCNEADIAQTDSSPGPDGCVDNGDFSLFIASFFGADCSATCGQEPVVACNEADIAQTDSSPGPDGCVDNGDFSLFIAAFFGADCSATCDPPSQTAR
jgi:hypothetical protein